MNLGENEPGAPASEEMVAANGLELADRWILSRLQRTVEQVTRDLEKFAVDDAAQAIYSFVWDEFCDWYVELAKPRLTLARDGVDVRRPLLYVLETTLRLAHPFMPFITEAIWQSLPRRAGDPESLMVAPYPRPVSSLIDAEAVQQMDRVIEITRAIRNLRAEMKVPPSRRIEAYVGGEAMGGDGAQSYVEALARVTYRESRPEQNAVSAVAGGAEIALPIGDLIDAPAELAAIEKEITGLSKELERVEGKLGNAQFLARAPQAIVDKEKRIQEELVGKLTKLQERRTLLGS
jgi:valyl-tRNA synthetase